MRKKAQQPRKENSRRKSTVDPRFAHELIPDHGPEMAFSEMLGRIENSKLAGHLRQSGGPYLLAELFRKLDPMCDSADFNIRNNARDRVIRRLNENAEAIWPTLWLTDKPSVKSIIGSMAARRQLARLFANEAELAKSVDRVTHETGVPGLLLLEASQDKLGQIRKSRRGALLRSKDLLSQKHSS